MKKLLIEILFTREVWPREKAIEHFKKKVKFINRLIENIPEEKR